LSDSTNRSLLSMREKFAFRSFSRRHARHTHPTTTANAATHTDSPIVLAPRHETTQEPLQNSTPHVPPLKSHSCSTAVQRHTFSVQPSWLPGASEAHNGGAGVVVCTIVVARTVVVVCNVVVVVIGSVVVLVLF
jgi:hypothetical protein